MEFGLLELFAMLAAPVCVQHALFRPRSRDAEGRSGAAGSSVDDPSPSRPGASEHAALDRAKSRVLVNLLNDLRTPLMMIKTPLEAGTGISPEAAGGVLDHAVQLQRGIERAAKILQMDADHEDDGGGTVTEFVDAVSYYVSSIRLRAERRGIRVVSESDIRRAAVEMDWPRVELLLETVTDYAVRGLGEGGVVVFRISTDDAGHVSLEVRTDRPLDPVDASAIAVEEVGDPLVLGLLLGRRTVRKFGGRLEFVGVDDDVSCRITLPIVESNVVAEPRPAPRSLPVDGEQRGTGDTTVLVVDDHVGTRTYLRFALRKYHRILEASDGKEALEIVRAEKPDLVISDIMMPVMDGNELCRAMKTDDELRHIPIFLVTANSIRTLKTESLESGADDFLVKPFDVKEAVIRINNEIRTRRDLRSRYRREVVIKPSDITVTPEDEALINRAREIVEENMGNADFSIQDLASEMGLSSRQLQRRLRETLDQSPVEFVRSLRLQRAAQLLGGQYGNVSEVAYAVGFTSLSYFAKCFKEEYGSSPSSYKEEHDA